MSRSVIWLALCLFACEGQGLELAPDAELLPEEHAQGSVPRGGLVINEVAAKPGAGEADWIEILNRSDTAIDLCDFFVTDALDRLDHYYHLGLAAPPATCVETPLEAGAYLVVVADGSGAGIAEHAPFRLGEADEVHIVSLGGEAVDSLVYLVPSESSGLSLARIPNAEGRFWLAAPSKGQANFGATP